MENKELIAVVTGLLGLLGSNKLEDKKIPSNIYDDCLGKYCIIRSYGAGVFFGKVEQIEDNYTIKLSNARRIHYWDNHTASSCTDIALYGINENNKNSGDGTRIARVIDIHYISQIIEIIPCSDMSIKNLTQFRSWSENE